MDQQDDHKSFKQCIEVTGLDTEELHHIAVVGLKEVEAASIAALKASAVEFQKGHFFFFTVDAGGGTADFALMHIVSTEIRIHPITQRNRIRAKETGR
jgi:hypothetical protein